MHVTIIIILITTTVSTFGTAANIVDFELQLTITINMIIKSGESGQGLGVVVFVVLQQTTTDNYIIK